MVIINGKIFPMEGKNIECGYIRTNGKIIEEIGVMRDFEEKKKEKEEDKEKDLQKIKGEKRC